MKIRPETDMRFLCVVALVLATAWQAQGADEAVDVGGASERKAQQAPFAEDLCINVVKKVQQSNKYTEESIAPLCNEEMKYGGCDFFAEALSLASSHADFDAVRFCNNMAEAHFCAEIMDRLLQSQAVSDLAYGECERANKTREEAYCRKIKQMLAYAVQNDDLDTMRACYMIQAFTNLSTSKELEPTAEAPVERIITSSNKELEAGGQGKNATPPKIFQSGIVQRPVPLSDFGKGKSGNTSKLGDGGIIVQPRPVTPGGQAGNETHIITEPVPAGAGTASTGEGTILTKGVPAEPSPTAQPIQANLRRTDAVDKRVAAAPTAPTTMVATTNTKATMAMAVAPAAPVAVAAPVVQPAAAPAVQPVMAPAVQQVAAPAVQPVAAPMAVAPAAPVTVAPPAMMPTQQAAPVAVAAAVPTAPAVVVQAPPAAALPAPPAAPTAAVMRPAPAATVAAPPVAARVAAATSGAPMLVSTAQELASPPLAPSAKVTKDVHPHMSMSEKKETKGEYSGFLSKFVS